jgi:putative redox protein
MADSSSTVNIKWIASTSTTMVGVDSRGTPTVIEVWPDHEPQWRGLKASDLLLMSAASCSAYDVITILRKQREPLEGLEVFCTGEQDSEPSSRFTHIHLTYQFKGDINPEKVKRAIQLSEEKYCSVIKTLRGRVDITSDYVIME